jgi:hypothetical protein
MRAELPRNTFSPTLGGRVLGFLSSTLPRASLGTQPKRDMGGLRRLFNHPNQVLIRCVSPKRSPWAASSGPTFCEEGRRGDAAHFYAAPQHVETPGPEPPAPAASETPSRADPRPLSDDDLCLLQGPKEKGVLCRAHPRRPSPDPVGGPFCLGGAPALRLGRRSGRCARAKAAPRCFSARPTTRSAPQR